MSGGRPRPRSSLARAVLSREPRRRRPFLRRRLAIGVVVAALGALAWAVVSRAFAVNGLGGVVYAIHDAVWLPAYGAAWTRHAPWSLLYLAPAAVLLIEALLLLLANRSLIRGAHRAAIRLAIRSGSTGLARRFGPMGRRGTFARRVAAAERERLARAARADVVQALARGEARPPAARRTALRRFAAFGLQQEPLALEDLLEAMDAAFAARAASAAEPPPGDALDRALGAAIAASALSAAARALWAQALGTRLDPVDALDAQWRAAADAASALREPGVEAAAAASIAAQLIGLAQAALRVERADADPLVKRAFWEAALAAFDGARAADFAGAAAGGAVDLEFAAAMVEHHVAAAAWAARSAIDVEIEPFRPRRDWAAALAGLALGWRARRRLDFRAAVTARRDGRRPRWRERLDAAHGVVASGALAATLAVGGVGAAAIALSAAFDPEAPRETPDARILASYKDGDAPFVDATVNAAEGALFVARADGAVHRLALDTRLWSDETAAAPEMSGEVRALFSGCGALAPSACPQPEAVWALTSGGGLWERRDAEWRVRVSDRSWVGWSGAPVAHEAVQAVAASADGRWLAVAAGAEGLAVFDRATGAWRVARAASPALARYRADPSTTRLLWAGEAFLVAGAFGAVAIAPPDPATAAPPRATAIEAIAGRALDLDVAADGALLLEEGPCDNGARGCLRVWRVGSDGASAALIGGEISRDPRLSAAGARSAMLQSGRIVVVGDAGVHVYDPTRRAWTALDDGPIGAIFEDRAAGAVVYASGAHVYQIAAGARSRLSSAPFVAEIVQLLRGPDGAYLAVLGDGGVIRVGAGDVALAGVGGLDAQGRRERAFAVGDWVVMVGPSGALLHDVRTRRYAATPEGETPRAVRQGRGAFYGAGRAAWWVDAEAGVVRSITLSADPAPAAAFQAPIPALPAPLLGVTAADDALYVVDAAGAPHRVRPGALIAEPILGPARPGGPFEPRGVVERRDETILLAAQTLWRYDWASRGWSAPEALSLGGDAAVGMAAFSDALAIVTRDGAAFLHGPRRRPLIGHGLRVGFGVEALSDAFVTRDGVVLLAGEGAVFAYDAGRNAVTQSWGRGGGGDPLLLGAYAGAPIWRLGDAVFAGDDALEDAGSGVLTASLGARAAVVTRLGASGEPVLQFYDLSAGGPLARPQCLYGQSAPTGARALLDARAVTAEGVLALTDGGLHLHDGGARRWRGVAAPAELDADSRLHVLGDLAVVIAGDAAYAAPRSDFVVSSCFDGRLTPAWTVIARGVFTVDDGLGAIATLSSDGAVGVWRDGRASPRLAGASLGPDPRALRRVHGVGEASALFVGLDAVWRYDGRARRWVRRGYRGAPTGFVAAAVDARRLDETRFALTLTGADGAVFVADFDAAGGADIALARLDAPASPEFPFDPAELIDVARIDGRYWAFLTVDGLYALDPATRRFVGSARFAEPMTERRLADRAGRWTIEEGAAGAVERIWLLPADRAAAFEGAAAIADRAMAYAPSPGEAFAIGPREDALWRLDADLALWRCAFQPGAAVRAGGARGPCSVQATAPIALSAADLVAARGSGEDVLLWIDGRSPGAPHSSGVYRLERGARRLTRVAALDVGFADAHGRAARIGERLALIDADGAVFAYADGAVEALGVRGAERLLAFPGGRVWADLGEGFALIAPAPDALTEAAALTVDASGRAHWMAAPGLLRREGADGVQTTDWRGAPGAPSIEDARAVAALTETGAPIWAVQDRAGGVDVLAAGLCRPASPAAAWLLEPERCVRLIGRVDAEALGPPDAAASPRLRYGFVAADVATLRFDAMDVQLRLAPLAELGPPPAARGADLSAAPAVSPTADPPYRSPPPAPDRLPELQGAISRADGRDYLDAPSIAEAGPATVAIAVGARVQRTTAATIGVEAPALQAGWIAWSRADGVFVLSDGDGPTALRPEEMIVDSRFAFAAPGATAYLGGRRFSVANAHGLWRWSAPAADLSAGPERLRPAGGAARGVYDGAFHLEGPDGLAILDAATGAARSAAGAEASIDALRLSRGIGGDVVDAALGGAPAWAPAGFAFDDRRHVVIEGGRVLIDTPLGLVADDAIQRAAPAPFDGPAEAYVRVGGALYAARGGAWRRLGAGGWSESGDPFADAALARLGDRVWRRAGGVGLIEPARADEAWRVAGDGLGFDAERLIDAAAFGDEIIVTTPLGAHAAPALLDHRIGAPPTTPGVGGRLILEPVGPGAFALLTDDRSLAWSAAARRWEPSGDVSARDRVAAETERLRIVFRGGAPEAFVRLQQLEGGPARWARFGWAAGELFPFDRARAVDAVGDRLWVGSDFGLSVFDRTGFRRLYDMRSSPEATVAAVPAIGRPLAAPGVAIAWSGAVCAVLEARAARPCSAQERALPFDDRLVAERDGVWRWRVVDGRLVSDYRVDGAFSLRHVGPDQPVPTRWPHDTLVDFALCRAVGDPGPVRRFELWRAPRRMTVATPDGVRFDYVSGPPPEAVDLRCQSRRLQIGAGAGQGAGATPPLGLYAHHAGASWAYDGAGWTRAGPAFEPTLAAAAAGRIPFAAQRLRAVVEEGGVRFEIRRLDDRWAALDWEGPALAIDRTLGAALFDGLVWRATPAGLAPATIRSDRLTLDPDRVVLIEMEGEAPGRLDRLTAGGSADAIRAAAAACAPPPLGAGPLLWARFGDGRVLVGAPSLSRDVDVFAPSAFDPFLDEALASRDGLGCWRRRGAPGSNGGLTITLRGEAIRLEDGRLSVDAFRELAVGPDGAIELITADGWWRAAPSLALDSQRRPAALDVAPLARRFFSGSDGDLCVALEDGATILFDAAGERTVGAACAERAGADGVFVYERRADGAFSFARARNGPLVERRLDGGRWGDRIVLSRPLATARGLHYLSAIGVVELGPDGETLSVLAADDAIGVAMDAEGGLTTIVPSGVGFAESGAAPDCARALELTAAASDRVVALEHAGDGRLAAILEIDGRWIEAELTCAAPGGFWTRSADVSDRFRVRAKALRPDAAVAELSVSVEQRRVVLGAGGCVVDLPVAWKAPPRSVDMGDDFAFILTDDRLFEISIDTALSRLADGCAATLRAGR